MIKKAICFIIGHKEKTVGCPYTGFSYTVCERCFPKNHTRGISFS